MVTPGILVFDMDGVLVEVSESYRETVVRTVYRLSGKTIARELIQDYKNQGGWNNDWALSQRILRDLGYDIEYKTVVDQFNKLFLGHNGTEGLINREQWIPRPGFFERLGRSFQLAIFSGRLRYEADITLNRSASNIRFDPMICAEDVRLGKPDPEGLLRIAAANPDKRLLYFGDIVDDARASRAAGVPFVGVVAKNHSARDEVIRLFREEEAVAIVDDINEVEELLR
jgi:HAD superfamily hydrolase (TIGR01548 family)